MSRIPPECASFFEPQGSAWNRPGVFILAPRKSQGNPNPSDLCVGALLRQRGYCHAQRRLHAVVNRRQSPQSKAANWLARMIAIVLNKVRGRG
jgi:hypothetical protein